MGSKELWVLTLIHPAMDKRAGKKRMSLIEGGALDFMIWLLDVSYEAGIHFFD